MSPPTVCCTDRRLGTARLSGLLLRVGMWDVFGIDVQTIPGNAVKKTFNMRGTAKQHRDQMKVNSLLHTALEKEIGHPIGYLIDPSHNGYETHDYHIMVSPESELHHQSHTRNKNLFSGNLLLYSDPVDPDTENNADGEPDNKYGGQEGKNLQSHKKKKTNSTARYQLHAHLTDDLHRKYIPLTTLIDAETFEYLTSGEKDIHERPYHYPGNLAHFHRLGEHHDMLLDDTVVDAVLDEYGEYKLDSQQHQLQPYTLRSQNGDTLESQTGMNSTDDSQLVSQNSFVEKDKEKSDFLTQGIAAVRKTITGGFTQRGAPHDAAWRRERLKAAQGHFRETHKVARLSDFRDHTSQHLGEIMIGRAKQVLNVIFDSGSTNLWLASTLCNSHQCLQNKETLYDPDKSGKEAERLCPIDPDGCQNLHIEFGSGYLEGPLARDTVYVAGHKVPEMPFALVARETGDVFATLKYGGVMGLAFEDMAAAPLKGILARMTEVDSNREGAVMSFYFTMSPNIRSGVYFGGANPELFHGDPICLEVQREHYWQTGLDKIGIRWGMHGNIHWFKDMRGQPPPSKIFWDTGTTWNGGPTYMTNYIMSYLQGYDWARRDCNDLEVNARNQDDQKPWLVLDMCVDKDCDQIYRVIQPPQQWFVGGGGHTCKPGLMSIDVPAPFGPDIFITGEIFMRVFHTIFQRASGKTPSQVCIAKNKSQYELDNDPNFYSKTKELSSISVIDDLILTRKDQHDIYGADALDE